MSKEKMPHDGKVGKVDALFINDKNGGLTLKELCEGSGFNKRTVLGHIFHLKKRHSFPIVRKDGLYFVDVSELEEPSKAPVEELPPKKLDEKAKVEIKKQVAKKQVAKKSNMTVVKGKKTAKVA